MNFRLFGTNTYVHINFTRREFIPIETIKDAPASRIMRLMEFSLEDRDGLTRNTYGSACVGIGVNSGKSPKETADSTPDNQPESHTEPLPESTDEGHSQQQ